MNSGKSETSLRVPIAAILLFLCGAILTAQAALAQGLFPGRISRFDPGKHGLATIGDFNEDGKADLAFPERASSPTLNDWRSPIIVILIGRGDGTFVLENRVDAGQKMYKTVFGDFNGDGHQDIAATGGARGGGVSILLGRGDATFEPPLVLEDAESYTCLTVADFNLDGDQDLAACEISLDSVAILLGNGDGSFDPPTRFGVGGAPDFALLGDFNGDGRPDLAMQERTTNDIGILINDGSGMFTQTRVPAGLIKSVAVSDFNLDGFDDLAVSYLSFPSWVFQILQSNGDGTFILQEELVFEAAGSSLQFKVDDLNADGKPDVVASLGRAFLDFYGNDNISVYLGKGDGTLDPEIRFEAGGVASAIIGIVDADGNSTMDLLFTSKYSGRGFFTVPGNGDGTFSPAPRVDVGLRPFAVTAGLLDGDENLDLAVANWASGDVSILPGNGDGTFDHGVAPELDGNPVWMAMEDFDQDGNSDLALNLDGGLSLLLGNGDGTFAPEFRQEDVVGDRWLVAGDFDRDGIPDLASTSFFPAEVTVSLGTGSGMFSASSFSVGLAPWSITKGDFNGDGFDDLVTANNWPFPAPYDGSDDLSVLYGLGDGTFSPEVRIVTGKVPNIVAAGDLNGDGLDDLVVANDPSSKDISVLLANGEGGFLPQEDLEEWSGPTDMEISDLDSDGHMDLIVVNTGSEEINFFPGNGDGTFGPVQGYIAGGGPTFLAVGDFNRDGRPDLAVSDQYSSDVAILFNQGADEDGDGITNESDACLGSDLRPTVIVGECNSGVENRSLGDGCMISDSIGLCSASAGNHGAFVSCVSRLGREFESSGAVDSNEKGAIQSCAARGE